MDGVRSSPRHNKGVRAATAQEQQAAKKMQEQQEKEQELIAAAVAASLQPAVPDIVAKARERDEQIYKLHADMHLDGTGELVDPKDPEFRASVDRSPFARAQKLYGLDVCLHCYLQDSTCSCCREKGKSWEHGSAAWRNE